MRSLALTAFVIPGPWSRNASRKPYGPTSRRIDDNGGRLRGPRPPRTLGSGQMVGTARETYIEMDPDGTTRTSMRERFPGKVHRGDDAIGTGQMD
jgi:hypothetical protein